ncbi:MAG TPA: hypothetical protein VIL08_06115 [Limnochorda sp.]
MTARWIPLAMVMVALVAFPGEAMAAAGVQGNELFAELPPEHWSYGALRSLSAAGLVSEPPQGFGGALTVTRLEMALEVGEAMERLGARQTAAGALSLPVLVARYNREAERPLGLEQMRLLEELAQEFSAELNVLGYTFVPSPQSFRLQEPPTKAVLPELDAVWIDLGDDGNLTLAPWPLGLREPALAEGRLPLRSEQEQAEGNQGLALGARIRVLPGLSLEGEVAPWGDAPGYRIGAGLDLGDVYISGGYDVPTRLASGDASDGSPLEDGRTRWGVRWTAGDAELTAAYEYVGLDQLEIRGRSDLPTRLELGLGVTTKDGAIRVGWSREARNVVGVAEKAQPADDPEPVDDDGDETAGAESGQAAARQVNTTLHLTYDLSNVASFTLGYRLIDFTAVTGSGLEDGKQAEAMAEFTLRF